MKKVLLLSDSHGNLENMITAVERVKPDMILHMGDCQKDALRLQGLYPQIDLQMVLGNCDWCDGVYERMLQVEGFRILMCHGHRYNVKASLLALEYAAREKGADVVVFGHTHHLFYDWYPDLYMMNPGSIGAPPYGIPPSYGILEIDGENHRIHMKTGYLA